MVIDQLVTGYGNKAAAEGALTQHLAGVAQQAVSPDGTLDAAKFAKLMQPYQKALNGNGGMYFPQLRQNFANAHAAQETLDTLTAQRGVGESIANGALRDTGTNNITAQSFNRWLGANTDQLTRAQGPQAVARLRQIGNALRVAVAAIARRSTLDFAPLGPGHDTTALITRNRSITPGLSRPTRGFFVRSFATWRVV